MREGVEGRAAGQGGLAGNTAGDSPGEPNALAGARVPAPLRERKRRSATAHWETYGLTRLVVALLFKVLVGPRVRGQRRVPRRGPLLVVANHLSYLEPPLLAVALPRRMTYPALYELLELPWLGPFFRRLGALPVRRGGLHDLRSLRTVLDVLAQGEAVAIFPEGTRSLAPGLLRADPGVSLLAVRSGAPILPVAVTGTEELTSIGRILSARLRRTRVRVVVGEPFHLPAAPGKVDHRALADRIMLEVAKLLPPAYRGVYAQGVAADEATTADKACTQSAADPH